MKGFSELSESKHNTKSLNSISFFLYFQIRNYLDKERMSVIDSIIDGSLNSLRVTIMVELFECN